MNWSRLRCGVVLRLSWILWFAWNPKFQSGIIVKVESISLTYHMINILLWLHFAVWKPTTLVHIFIYGLMSCLKLCSIQLLLVIQPVVNLKGDFWWFMWLVQWGGVQLQRLGFYFTQLLVGIFLKYEKQNEKRGGPDAPLHWYKEVV